MSAKLREPAPKDALGKPVENGEGVGDKLPGEVGDTPLLWVRVSVEVGDGEGERVDCALGGAEGVTDAGGVKSELGLGCGVSV